MKRKELFWITVPCFCLMVLAAVWSRGQGTFFSYTPFEVFIEKVEKTTLSDYEIWQGYDTKLEVTLSHKGKAPNWWGASHESIYYGSASGGGELIYKTAQGDVPVNRQVGKSNLIFYFRPALNEETQNYTATYLLKLADLPKRPNKTVFRIRTAIEKYNSRQFLGNVAQKEYVVRQPNETVKTRRVTKNTKLHITEVVIENPRHGDKLYGPISSVEFRFRHADSPVGFGKGVAFRDNWLEDEKGNRLPTPKIWGVSCGVQEGNAVFKPALIYGTHLNLLPMKPRNIVFVATVSLSQTGPVELRCFLRRNGINLQGKLSPQDWSVRPSPSLKS